MKDKIIVYGDLKNNPILLNIFKNFKIEIINIIDPQTLKEKEVQKLGFEYKEKMYYDLFTLIKKLQGGHK